jgi:hypothetical protein
MCVSPLPEISILPPTPESVTLVKDAVEAVRDAVSK